MKMPKDHKTEILYLLEENAKAARVDDYECGIFSNWEYAESLDLVANVVENFEETSEFSPECPSIDKIRLLARQVGYAIGEHGSKVRDFDIIAAPWVADAVSAKELVDHLCVGMNARQIGEIESKPCGRLACSLQINGWFKIIDLSIVAVVEQ
jgi:hypothetical protein